MKKRLKQMHLDNLKLEHIQLKNAQKEWKSVEKLMLADAESVPFHLHIGMRTIKTVVAVMICGVFGWAIGQPPLFSMFAAVVCVQNKTNDSILSGFNRMIGTIIGGLYSVLTVYASWIVHISQESLLFYMIVSGMLIPVIITTLYFRKPTTTSLACIVFIAISLSDFYGMNPLFAALWRTFDTCVGIFVVLCIEICFPYRPKEPALQAMEKK